MKYRNKTDHRLEIPGVGSVEANGEIEVDAILENPNLERIAQSPQQPVQGVAPQAPTAPTEQQTEGTE